MGARRNRPADIGCHKHPGSRCNVNARSHRNGKRTVGIVLSVLGAACLACACLLFSCNRYDDARARSFSDDTMVALHAAIANSSHKAQGEPGEVVDGVSYIGYLTIPSLDLVLPVATELTMDKLQNTPCCYSGSPDSNDLVIGAHNFDSHFGRIRDLSPGNDVLFTDYRNVTYSYKVEKIEELLPGEVDEAINSDYDLSLFTCTYDGMRRVTVRCKRV